ncbi:arsenate reductase/protein-tyrosine-phosphatase family protein [Streptomyces sp. CB02923]|uniref:arsenate reductase/protein-tyrosine-phosphatase family protein n=1 Tax=Streptomyces sp. CB02923 TaxID=1718985 RepID=UPI00308309C5
MGRQHHPNCRARRRTLHPRRAARSRRCRDSGLHRRRRLTPVEPTRPRRPSHRPIAVDIAPQRACRTFGCPERCAIEHFVVTANAPVQDPCPPVTPSPIVSIMHISFICTGNICRSPMAALMFQEELSRAGMAHRVSVTSAGVGTWHTGKRIDERAAGVLSARGYPVHHVAAQLGERDLDADLFVAMDSRHVAELEARLETARLQTARLETARGEAGDGGAGEPARRIRLLRSFSPECGGAASGADQVPDPYYGTEADFAEVFSMIEAAMPGLVEWVRSRAGDGGVPEGAPREAGHRTSAPRVRDVRNLPAQRDEADRLGEQESPDLAASALGELLPVFERVYGPEHLETLTTRDIHAHWLAEGGHFRTALSAFQAYLPDWERLAGPDHPGTLHCRQNISYWTGESGDFDLAVELSRELLPMRARALGPTHPDTLLTEHRLAYWIGEGGDPATALARFREILETRTEHQGPEHADTLTARHEIARRTGETGEAEKAAEQFEELVPRRERVLGPRHISMLTTRHEHAKWVGEAGAPDKALAMLHDLWPVRKEVQGAHHPRTLLTQHELGRWTAVSGDRDAALPIVQDVLRARDRVLGPNHPHTRLTRDLLAGLGVR